MAEMLSPSREKVRPSRITARTLRRRRRLDLRTLAASAAMVVGFAWIIVFGVGILIR